MKLPRDISAERLVSALGRIGYVVTRRTGSHLRLTCREPVEHHLTIPDHDPIRVGTLAAILRDIAERRHMSRADLIAALFG